MPAWHDESFCYLTTTGRVTGKAHTIEIWFAVRERTLYLLSGGGMRADWVRNLVDRPAVAVKVGRQNLTGAARLIEDAAEEAYARRALAAKYQDWQEGKRLSAWARTSLPVAVDLIPAARHKNAVGGALRM